MLKLLELFAGVGAQRMALDRLGIEYKSVGIMGDVPDSVNVTLQTW